MMPFLLLAGAGGCNTFDQRLPLNYSIGAAAAVRGDGPVQIEMPADAVLHRFGDGQQTIGTAGDAGMYNGAATVGRSPAQWIAGAYRDELALAGYQPQIVDRVPPDAARAIQLEIARIWTNQQGGLFTVGAVADLRFRLTIIRNGLPVEQIEVTCKGQDRNVVHTEDQSEKAMESALRAGVRKSLPYFEAATRR
jgi:hypothetical protein